MKYLLVFSLSFFLFSNTVFAQHSHISEEKPTTCGYDEYQENFLSNDENKKIVDQYEKAYQKYIKSKDLSHKSSVVKTLPIVVHILHSGDPLGTDDNPTDAQIASTINLASLRFRQMQSNAGSYSNQYYGIDPEIELCMSTVDPDGNYTSGVLRYYEPVNTINPTSAFVSTILWDVTKYANIIIAKDISACGRYRGGVDYTEYAAFCFWDGLVCHEIGHQLSLQHTFRQGCTNGDCLLNGDFVCDTPPKAASGSGGNACGSAAADSCTSDEDDLSSNNPYRPVANGGLGNQPDMLENYMDYTGNCWDAFTSGQKTRMHFNLTNNRTALTNHSAIACSGPSSVANDIGVVSVVSNQNSDCEGIIFPSFDIYNYGTNTVNTCEVKFYADGSIVSSEQFSNLNLSPSQSISKISLIGVQLPPGFDFAIEVEAVLPNGNIDANSHNNSDYTKASFVENSFCYANCANFNNNTASAQSTIVTISDNFNIATTDVELCYQVEGDLSLATETFNVYDESNNLIGTTTPVADCSGPTSLVCVQVTTGNYNNWINDNQVSITFTPSSTDINPFLCSINQACVKIFVDDTGTGGNCAPSLTLSGVNNGSNTQPYNQNDNETDGVITSTQTISSNAIIDYDSGTEINLLEGFQTLLGAIFDAFIDGCDNGGGGNNATTTQVEDNN